MIELEVELENIFKKETKNILGEGERERREERKKTGKGIKNLQARNFHLRRFSSFL